VYSEGDLLPSLIVDRYADVLVLQTLSQGTEVIKSMITEILIDEFGPHAVIERNDARVRLLEGLPRFPAHSMAALPKSLKFQHGLRFTVAPPADRRPAHFSINVRIDSRHALQHRHQIVEERSIVLLSTVRSPFISPVCVERLSE
jgi:23S rRNA G2069 N7-methylase RlmK/C1962 C5-methylase RlmI